MDFTFELTPPIEEKSKSPKIEFDINFLTPPKRQKKSPRLRPCLAELTAEEKKLELFNLAKKGEASKITQLIALDVHLNAKNSLGYTALIWAVIRGHVNVVDLLIQAGADIFLKDNKERTALYHAVFNKQEIIAFKLLERMSGGQRSLLKKDIFFKEIVIKYRLRNKKFNVNAQNAKGETMFMLAARYGHVKTSKLLISYGADVSIQNVHGKTAYEQAEEYRNNFEESHIQFREVLRQKHTLIFSLVTHQPKASLNLNEEVIIEGVKKLKIGKNNTP